MGITTGPAIGLGVASLAGAGISAGTSLAAAGDQASAAQSAQQLQAQEAQNALNQNQSQFNTTQANEAPWIQQGQQAVGQLGQLASNFQPWNQTFQAPTAAQAAQTPGYQFQLQQGISALDNSAAAAGGLGSGATGAALEQYGQGLASQNYQQVYNNAFQQYGQQYQQFLNNNSTQFNQLATLAGLGQTATGTAGQLGQQAANTGANISLTSGAQQGQDIQNAGAANASGYVGVGNALSGGISNIGQALTLQQLLAGQNGQNGSIGIGTGNPNGPGGFAPNMYDY